MIKQGIYNRFESADILCKQFNKFINMLKKEKEETKEIISMVRMR